MLPKINIKKDNINNYQSFRYGLCPTLKLNRYFFYF